MLDVHAPINLATADGETLTLHISRLQVRGANFAFAAVLVDGSVVTWGSPFYGGSSRAEQGQLKNVQQIQAFDCAFAAILGGGLVVTYLGSDLFWW